MSERCNAPSPCSVIWRLVLATGAPLILVSVVYLVAQLNMAAAYTSLDPRLKNLGGAPWHVLCSDCKNVFLESSTLDWGSLGFRIQMDYDWGASTEMNYRSPQEEFCGKFQHIRSRLDYSFHSHYSCARQKMQDVIIEVLLNARTGNNSNGRVAVRPSETWMIFTAGVMGAGKSYTIHKLHSQGRFPLDSFIIVDPDEIRRMLPEFGGYLKCCAEDAGTRTRKEAGMLAEILVEVALERGFNVLNDGSLRDARWYEEYFAHIRHTKPNIKLGIIHVTAPWEVIVERVKMRAKETGRVVPKDVLMESMEHVPKSVALLKNQVDFFLHIANSGNDEEPQIVTAEGRFDAMNIQAAGNS